MLPAMRKRMIPAMKRLRRERQRTRRIS